MSITQSAKTLLDVRVIGHDSLQPTVRTGAGTYKTTQRGCVLAPPSMIPGGTLTGMIARVEDDSAGAAESPALPDLQQDVQAEDKPRRRGRKAKASPVASDPAQDMVQVSVTMPGFGTVPTTYRFFDIGQGILRIGLGTGSWVPAAAVRAEDGSFVNVFEFDKAPGRRYIHVGLEFAHSGVRSLVLVELPE